MTAKTDLLPLPEPDYLMPQGQGCPDIPAWSENTVRQIVAHATATQSAEIEALRAEVAETREFRDKMANAIGNDQLRRFIEKHGEPVPLTIRMQAAEARADKLAEALREAYRQVRELCDCYGHVYPEASFVRYEALLHNQEARNG